MRFTFNFVLCRLIYHSATKRQVYSVAGVWQKISDKYLYHDWNQSTEDENVNSGLLFSAEADEVGPAMLLVVMGLESSKYYIRVEELPHVCASLGYDVDLAEAEEMVDEEYEEDEGKG